MTLLNDLWSHCIIMWQMYIAVISLVTLAAASLSSLITKQLDRLNWNDLVSVNAIVKAHCHSNRLKLFHWYCCISDTVYAFLARNGWRGLLWLLATKFLNAHYIEVQHIKKMSISSVYLKFHKVNIAAQLGPRSRCRTLSVLQKLPYISVKSQFHAFGNHCLGFYDYRLILCDLLIFCALSLKFYWGICTFSEISLKWYSSVNVEKCTQSHN